MKRRITKKQEARALAMGERALKRLRDVHDIHELRAFGAELAPKLPWAFRNALESDMVLISAGRLARIARKSGAPVPFVDFIPDTKGDDEPL